MRLLCLVLIAIQGRGWASKTVFSPGLAAAAHTLSDSQVHESPVVNDYPGAPLQAAAALLRRVLPKFAAQFELELLPASSGSSAMQLDARDGKVVLRGSGGVEIASALNWYLNDFCNVTFDWNTYAEGQLPDALPLPLPTTSNVVRRRLPYSYYLNVCTYGYSLAFAPTSYWERHVDWMAMNGVNLPLSFIGQEWAWVVRVKRSPLASPRISHSTLSLFPSPPLAAPP